MNSMEESIVIGDIVQIQSRHLDSVMCSVLDKQKGTASLDTYMTL